MLFIEAGLPQNGNEPKLAVYSLVLSLEVSENRSREKTVLELGIWDVRLPDTRALAVCNEK